MSPHKEFRHTTSIRRRTDNPVRENAEKRFSSLEPGLELQNRLGNQGVMRLLNYGLRQPSDGRIKGTEASCFVQAKLAIGESGDRFEKEADHVADAVSHNTAIDMPKQWVGAAINQPRAVVTPVPVETLQRQRADGGTLPGCSDLDEAIIHWAMDLAMRRIDRNYHNLVTWVVPQHGRPRMWSQWASDGGVMDVDIYFRRSPPGGASQQSFGPEQHVKMLVELFPPGIQRHVAVSLYDWFNGIPVEIGHWDGIVDCAGRGGCCEVREVVAPVPLYQRPYRRSEVSEVIQPKTEAGRAPNITVPTEWALAGMRGGGQALPESLRAFFEPRLGADFSRVRIHTDSAASESARALGAQAYTAGCDIVFAADQYQPQTEHGRKLLAHELVHVMQQRNSGPRVQRQSRGGGSREAPTPNNPPLNFRALMTNIDSLRRANREAEALALVQALVALVPHALRAALMEARDVLRWLVDASNQDAAIQFLQMLRTTIDSAATDVPEPHLNPMGSVPEEPLIAFAREEAAAGHHTLAVAALGVAFLVEQVRLQRRTAARLQYSAVERVASLTRWDFYDRMREGHGRVREIMGFYLRSERDARARGDLLTAADAYRWHLTLQTALTSEYLLAGPAPPRARLLGANPPALAEDVITMEATLTQTSRGYGYRLYGLRGAPEIVSPYAGQPYREHLGVRPYYGESLGTVLDVARGQEEFQADLIRRPEIAAEFAGASIHPDSLDDRIRIWRAVYRARRMESPVTALQEVLRLVEHYLAAFTVHTTYSIRDFGRSYLDTDFPTDVLGRVVRDCGVYAVTVAYEVYRALANLQPRPRVSFQIVVSADHAVLVIHDADAGAFFVVSNDHIFGPAPSLSPAPTRP